MSKYVCFFSQTLCLVFLTTVVIAIIACQGPQGPNWKEQVSLSLDHFSKAEDELKKGNYEEAEKEYTASLEISPRPITYWRLAQIKNNKKNDSQGALADLDQALKLAPNYQRAIILRQQIQIQLQGSNGKPAASARASAPSLAPENNKVEIPAQELIQSVAKPEETAQAKTEAEKPEQSDSSQKPASETKSSAPVIEQPNQQAAIPVVSPQASQETTKQETVSSESETVLREAREAAEKGDWGRAQSEYKKLADKNPMSATVQYHYGYASFNLNQLEEAKTAFSRTVELDPKNADAFNNLGVTLEKLNQGGEAMKAYQSAVDLGGNADAFFNLALLKEKRGQYKDSVELYEKYLELDSKSSSAEYARQRIEKLRRLAY